ncbi:MAG: hypothetical protein ACE5EW_02500 [Thermoplasmata archaeon]
MLFSLLLGIALVGILVSGMARAGDVASSDAHGTLGMGAAQPATAVQDSPGLLPEVNAGAVWLDVVLYVVVTTLILVAYALAARKVTWLRPRRRRHNP